jgi:hypothetical protein
MNEKIKQLAEQAGIYKLDLSDETEYWIIEKFAELIVRECAQLAEDAGTKKEFMDNIKLQQDFAPR